MGAQGSLAPWKTWWPRQNMWFEIVQGGTAMKSPINPWLKHHSKHHFWCFLFSEIWSLWASSGLKKCSVLAIACHIWWPSHKLYYNSTTVREGWTRRGVALVYPGDSRSMTRVGRRWWRQETDLHRLWGKMTLKMMLIWFSDAAAGAVIGWKERRYAVSSVVLLSWLMTRRRGFFILEWMTSVWCTHVERTVPSSGLVRPRSSTTTADQTAKYFLWFCINFTYLLYVM